MMAEPLTAPGEIARRRYTGEMMSAEAPLRQAIVILILSFLVVMLDGYDLLCMAFVAPAMASIYGFDVAQFGPVFGAGVAGVLLGGLSIGALGDRFGRKRILLCSVALFGLFSLMPAFDPQFGRLLAYRFVTGLGLGGALPCVAALTAESAPQRLRGMFVSIMYGGVATGGVVGGLIASRLIPAYGWESAFLLGGITPLLLLPVLWIVMPESRRFVQSFEVEGAADHHVGRRVGRLFEEERSKRTLLLWATAFFGLLAFGAIISWLPIFITRQGFSMHQAILGPVIVNLGGIIGTLLIGFLVSRLPMALTVAVTYLLAGAAIVAIALLMGPKSTAFVAILVAGFFLLGAINGANALITGFYPASIRATGIGWALGVGRMGGIIGPMAVGLLLQWHVDVENILLLIAASAGISAVTIGIFARFPNGAAGLT